MTDESPAMEQPYEIVSIRRAETPPGVEGSDWHCYVIAFESAKTIHGHRQGKLWAVTREVEEIVVQLNERHLRPLIKHGRVQLVLKKKTHKANSPLS